MSKVNAYIFSVYKINVLCLYAWRISDFSCVKVRIHFLCTLIAQFLCHKLGEI